MQSIPIEKIFSNRDPISKPRKTFSLVQKGRTIDVNGMNIREETDQLFAVFTFFPCAILFYRMLFFYLHCHLVLRISGIMRIRYIKTCSNAGL